MYAEHRHKYSHRNGNAANGTTHTHTVHTSHHITAAASALSCSKYAGAPALTVRTMNRTRGDNIDIVLEPTPALIELEYLCMHLLIVMGTIQTLCFDNMPVGQFAVVTFAIRSNS